MRCVSDAWIFKSGVAYQPWEIYIEKARKFILQISKSIIPPLIDECENFHLMKHLIP